MADRAPTKYRGLSHQPTQRPMRTSVAAIPNTLAIIIQPRIKHCCSYGHAPSRIVLVTNRVTFFCPAPPACPALPCTVGGMSGGHFNKPNTTTTSAIHPSLIAARRLLTFCRARLVFFSFPFFPVSLACRGLAASCSCRYSPSCHPIPSSSQSLLILPPVPSFTLPACLNPDARSSRHTLHCTVPHYTAHSVSALESKTTPPPTRCRARAFCPSPLPPP